MKLTHHHPVNFRYGNEDGLEKKILLRSIAASLVIILLYIIYGIVSGDPFVAISSLVVLVVYVLCYTFVSYTDGSVLSKRIVITIIMGSVIGEFLIRGGLFGITSLNMCGLVILISIVFSGLERRIFVCLFVVLVLSLVWIQLFQKNWIADYRENHSETFLVTEIMVYFVYILYIGYMYKTEYERKRQIIIETNRDLEEANAEISTQNDYILDNNEQLKSLVEKLQAEQNKVLEANCLLKKANLEIAKKNEYITTINTGLETIVTERTHHVNELNRKIVHFAQYNAHRIRGPLARILGLIQIMNFDYRSTEILDKEQSGFYIENLRQNATELDEMVRGVTELLGENNILIGDNDADKLSLNED